jgi:hypothetical protein
MDFQSVDILASLPFLFMIFFSTTFSPGSGVPVIKELRYLFARFYFWCMIPSVQDSMEGCPAEDLNILYMILASLVGVVLFLIAQVFKSMKSKGKAQKKMNLRESMMDEEFMALQTSLYGEKALKRFNHMNSSTHSRGSKNGDKATEASA